jgi:hypothetical protein
VTALPLGVIAAVTVVESPGAIVGSVSWSNLTVQSVGVVAVIFTASSDAVPVFVTMNCWLVAPPAPPEPDRTWFGVARVSVYEPVIVTPSS